MNLLLNLCSILLTVAVDAFHRRHVVGTNSLRRGSMSNRRNDSFRFLSPNELPENESLKAKKSSKRLILNVNYFYMESTKAHKILSLLNMNNDS